MVIRNNKLGRALAASVGPFIVSLGMLFRFGNQELYPWIFLFVSFLICLGFYCIQAEFIVKMDKEGLICSAARDGLFDPEYIPYTEIVSVEEWPQGVRLRLQNTKIVDLHIKKNKRSAVLSRLNTALESGPVKDSAP